MNDLVSANPPSDLSRPARWEVLMQTALELWFRTTCRRMARALHGTHGTDAAGDMSAWLCRDIGLPPAEPHARQHFVNAEAQLGMFL